MSGGAGTRLWPASRENRPKQFLRLFGERSTFQETVLRVARPDVFGRPVVVANLQHRFLVAEQVAELGIEADIIIEPARRDSGPAILAGAAFIARLGSSPVIAALAADHVVSDPVEFHKTCIKAQDAAERGYIVTFGVRPTRPATEYGYIQPGQEIMPGIRAVAKFIEKPDALSAEKFISEGYLWNSGNFLFKTQVLIDEYQHHEHDSAQAVIAAVEKAATDLGFITLDSKSFLSAEAKSIDYAVMEGTHKAAVIPATYSWSDVGSWQAVWEQLPRDSKGNVTKGRTVLTNVCNSYVSTDKQLVAVLGLDNVAVITTEDCILVTKRDDASALRSMVNELKKKHPEMTEEHAKVHRPWGSYRSIDVGNRFQVKRIIVKPGSRLSLQKHHHRAEHWIVVRGTALVTIGEEKKIIHENESIYVPIGTLHRLENPGKIDLEMIEVQTGSYLGEDDIVRIDDDYRRS
jgi:mannose-1-phosphate guanylyltransferase/mannose-6-phosphate isomerase